MGEIIMFIFLELCRRRRRRWWGGRWQRRWRKW